MNELELNDALNRWFTRNYEHLRNEVSNNIANGQMNDYCDDLLNICIESFWGRSYESKLQIFQDNKIENFLLRCCSFQLKSGTSPFYHQYRKYYNYNGYLPYFMDAEDETDESNELYKCMKEEMKNLNWYETKLIQLKFYDKMSYKQIYQIHGLPITTLKREIQLVLDKIKNKCSNC